MTYLKSLTVREKLAIVGSPHYYYGKSIKRLLLHKMVLLISFFRTQKPESDLFRETERLKGSKKGMTALVLGSGPSVDLLKPEQLDEYIDDVFAINEFFELEVSKTISPQFYCLSDPAHFSQSDEYSEARRAQLETYLVNTNPILVVPHWSAKENVFNGLNKIFFDDRELSWFSSNIYPTKPRAYTSATLFKALAMACFLGYEKVFVLGLDNSNFKSYSGSANNLVLDSTNITARSTLTDPPTSIGMPQHKFTSGMAGRMQSYALLFGDLKLFPYERIINLSADSLVDVFRKEPSHPLVS